MEQKSSLEAITKEESAKEFSLDLTHNLCRTVVGGMVAGMGFLSLLQQYDKDFSNGGAVYLSLVGLVGGAVLSYFRMKDVTGRVSEYINSPQEYMKKYHNSKIQN